MHSQLMFTECIAQTVVFLLSLDGPLCGGGDVSKEQGKRSPSTSRVVQLSGSTLSTYFPAADAQQELQDVALLLLLKLLDVCDVFARQRVGPSGQGKKGRSGGRIVGFSRGSSRRTLEGTHDCWWSEGFSISSRSSTRRDSGRRTRLEV